MFESSGLGEKIKELRRDKGWTQEKLACNLGVSLSTVQRWEEGRGKPSKLAWRILKKLLEEKE